MSKKTSKKSAPKKSAPKAKTAPKAAVTEKPALAKPIKPAMEQKPKRISALDAAASVLAAAKEPMRAKDLIEQMAAKGLWTSPGGKTPEATLYAAMVREINTKGDDARFKKTDRGLFVSTGKGE